MSAALKIAVIVALVALASTESTSPASNKDKDKRGSEKVATSSQTYQTQQHAVPQQTFQYVIPQAAQHSLSAADPNSVAQYIFRQPVQQKEVAAVAAQYVQPQFQYVLPQGATAQKGVVGAQYAYPQAAHAQAYLGGQYYVHPGQASVLGAQYSVHPGAQYPVHPGASFYFTPHHAAQQQYYFPQTHGAHQQPFYFGGLPGDYRAYLGNRQAYALQGAQQIISPSGVEPRGQDGVAYVLPYSGGIAHQFQIPSGATPLVESQFQASAQAAPALKAAISSGKLSSKTNSERQQG